MFWYVENNKQLHLMNVLEVLKKQLNIICVLAVVIQNNSDCLGVKFS